MADARERTEWGRWASLMCVVANAAGAKAKPSDFNPYHVEQPRVVGMDEFARQFVAMCNGGKPRHQWPKSASKDTSPGPSSIDPESSKP